MTLIEFCKNGKLNEIRELFSCNIHVDAEIALRIACENGYIEIVKFLW